MVDDIEAQTLCSEILGMDRSIRFAGLANKMGKLVASSFRQGLEQVFSKQDLEANALTATLRMKTRKDYEEKLGKPVYTFALYEKLKRASIPIENSDYSLLLVSFDIGTDHEAIIFNKILPRIKQVTAAKAR